MGVRSTSSSRTHLSRRTAPRDQDEANAPPGSTPAGADKQVVLGIVPDEAAADSVAQSLKDWDKLDDDVKLNVIGVLVLDEDAKIKTQKLGRRS